MEIKKKNNVNIKEVKKQIVIIEKEMNKIENLIKKRLKITECKFELFDKCKWLLWGMIWNTILNLIDEEKINRKKIMKIFIKLFEEIKNSEIKIEFTEYLEWTWFIMFIELREKIWKLYDEIFYDDNKDYPILNFIEEILENNKKYFDFDLLDEKSKKECKSDNWNWYMYNKGFESKHSEAIIEFKNINEILNFIEKKWYYKF